MPEHVNFYENQKEALIRLRGTIVLYDGEPHYVMAITNHKGDGVLRIYLDPTGKDANQRTYCSIIDDFPSEHPSLGPNLDTWMTTYPNAGILRKRMDSKHFNRFRPFPLGMCNIGTGTYYLERQPLRPKTEQGLTRSMVTETIVSTADASSRSVPRGVTNLDLRGPEFRACVLAEHPSAAECLDALIDPKVKNNAAAFHRQFALVRGPIDMLFLAYKEDIIGVLPNRDFSLIRIGRQFPHTKEVVAELGLFGNIVLN